MIRSAALALALMAAFFASSALAQTTIINAPPTVIGDDAEINADTRLNVLTGGVVGNSFDANSGSKIYVSGGTVGNNLRINFGAEAYLSGGNVGDSPRLSAGASAEISGGSIGDNFQANVGASEIDLFGGEFRVNGSLIAGLTTVGSSLVYSLLPGSVLTGTYSDGTPFAFSTRDGDSFSTATLTLRRTSLPAIGSTTINAPPQAIPLGIRQGQTLNIGSGAAVARNFNAGRGSVVNVLAGASVGNNLEAVNSQINIHGGTVGAKLDAFHGTVVNVKGGTVGDSFDAHPGSDVNISGGSVGNFFAANDDTDITIMGGNLGAFANANSGSEFNIFDGTIGSFFNANSDSVVNIKGGHFSGFFSAFSGSTVSIASGSLGGNFAARSGSKVTISGGNFGQEFNAFASSEVQLRGTEFFINGVPMTGLSSTPTTLVTRNATLSGRLLDGSTFSFALNSVDLSGQDYFDPAATLKLALGFATADFDQDGDVDDDDLSAWQNAYSTTANGDADDDGITEGRDFLLWQRQYTGPEALLGLSVVPEPSSTLLTMALLGLIGCRRTPFA